MQKNIPTTTQLQFVDVKAISPLISSCQIKVLYAGKNRNRSFISKDTANKMADSLRGVPIVGQYLSQKKDFGDHGEEEMSIDQNGVSFKKTTQPYGFIPPNAKVWWKEFLDKDGITREYLMTEGYLWTGRNPEIKRILEKGNNQSMELDEESLFGYWSKVDGEWAKFENDNTEYFIISDALFSALCILGEDVEPCFEGANITNSKLIYSLDKNDFKEQMLIFMQELKQTLQDEGGEKMTKNLNNENGQDPIDNKPQEPLENVGEIEQQGEFAKKKEEDEKEADCEEPKDGEDNKETGNEKPEKKDDEENDEDKKKKKYNLEEVEEYTTLLNEYASLKSKYEAIEAELEVIKPKFQLLEEEKNNLMERQKDEMIKSFYMLSEADKKDVVENKAKYSLDEIESKLSVICVRNKVNFNLEDDHKNENNTEAPVTFNLQGVADTAPAWIKAVDRVAQKK